MNYIEAVKELVNNPKAIAITFPTSKGISRRIELKWKTFRGESYTYLVFPATETRREQTVIAHSPEFLLREDFTVVYKEEKKYTEIEIGVAYHKGFQQGYNAAVQETKQREERAFQKFKETWRNLIGD